MLSLRRVAGSPDLTVVLDDDPTGVQAVRDVPVVLQWSPQVLARAAQAQRPSIHVMTNIRSLSPAEAEARTFEAASAAREALPGARLMLRGDSTLRGHVHEEYRAVRHAAYPQRAPVLLVVPALPAAGRVTRGGVHLLVSDGTGRPLHETEYARDGGFAYQSSRLLEWVEERTGGELAGSDGSELPLVELRLRGAEAVCDAIKRAATSGRPAACAPDAESIEDLQAIAEGLRLAERAGVEVLVRSAPTFAGVLAGTLANGLIDPPRANSEGVLIVCGSYVSGTTRQLDHLRVALGVEPIEANVHALVSDDPGPEVRRLARLTSDQLRHRGIALLSTPRQRPAELVDLTAGEQIAGGLADVVSALERLPGVLIAKGGITSHILLERGLRAGEARVAGPIAAGVSLWHVDAGTQPIAYVVFPGNVGGAEHLTHVVQLVAGT
jgi:uncharacterized protein YgbK (DUF1537 family)